MTSRTSQTLNSITFLFENFFYWLWVCSAAWTPLKSYCSWSLWLPCKLPTNEFFNMRGILLLRTESPSKFPQISFYVSSFFIKFYIKNMIVDFIFVNYFESWEARPLIIYSQLKIINGYHVSSRHRADLANYSNTLPTWLARYIRPSYTVPEMLQLERCLASSNLL